MNRVKIQPSHLIRNAYVYVRQSTHHQVVRHLESQQRQYELTALARELGWEPKLIEVIDDDLGISASGRFERSGFERLISNVALGRAGLVLGIEVSRLARNNHDWYKLLDLCSVRHTLVGDADGLYDPSEWTGGHHVSSMMREGWSERDWRRSRTTVRIAEGVTGRFDIV